MLHSKYLYLKAINEVFKRLNKLRRWTAILSKGTYNELNKQALNCIIAYILASFVEESGEPVLWERFPKIALYRAFQKIYVVFNTPEFKYDEIFDIGNINKAKFREATHSKITETTDKDFADFLCESVGTMEENIYKAATKIATYIELQELESQCNSGIFRKKLTEILFELQKYSNIPGMTELTNSENEIFKTLQFISSSGLRHHIRWCEIGYLQECSILGHLFDTACFAYFMSLELEPKNEKLATQRFFMGIYHDLAEAWTTDIPSPIKDSIPGFRDASEKYEQKVLEENLYAKLPDFLVAKIRDVMFEDEINVEKHKALIKGADYLSADSECWRQYVLGSRDPYFMGAIERRIEGIENGTALLPPECGKLFEFFRNYAKKLHLDELNDDPNL